MAGHSRWAQIKHKKAISDQKRGQLFSKLARLISLAASSGSANPEENPRLRDAVLKARARGMSRETIERAIGRSSGPSTERGFTAVTYEAYGPGGVAILIETVTDNTNRTHQELREILGHCGGKVAEPGAVRWLFDRKLVFGMPLPTGAVDNHELALIDAGAREISHEAGRLAAVVNPEQANDFRAKLASHGIPILGSDYEYIPRTRVSLDPHTVGELEELLDALDGHDDVQEIYTNANL